MSIEHDSKLPSEESLKNILSVLGGHKLEQLDPADSTLAIGNTQSGFVEGFGSFFQLGPQQLDLQQPYIRNQFRIITPPNHSVLVYRISKDNFQIARLDSDSAGWDVFKLNNGVLFEFNEVPAVFKRAESKLRQFNLSRSRYNAVELPLDQIATPKSFRNLYIDLLSD